MTLLAIKSDLAFRAVFGRNKESCRRALAALLEDILQITISDLTYINPLNLQDYDEDKMSEMDIELVCADGKRIDVEMQLLKTEGFKERMVYYCASLVNESLDAGMDYSEMRQSKVISLMDFLLFKQNDRLMNRFTFREAEDGFELTDVAEIIFLEMVKLPDKPVEDMSNLERWLYFLRYANDASRAGDLQYILTESEGIKMAYEVLTEVSADEHMRAKIRQREKAIRDSRSQLLYARNEGREEGREEGFQEGLNTATENVARNMLSLGLDIHIIAKTTGLAEERIAALR